MIRQGTVPLLMLGLALWIRPASAQWTLRLNRLAGEVGGTFDGSWLEIQRPQPLIARTYQEWIRLNLRGFVRDPRILAFQVVARPTLLQGEYLPVVDSLGSNGGGNGLSGAFRIQVARAAPINGEILARSSRDLRRTRFGGSVDQRASQWSATLNDRNPLLPMTFLFRKDRKQTSWASSVAQSQLDTDERTSTLRLQADNRKTNLLIERLAFRLEPGSTDYVRRMGVLRHTQQWGKGSRLRSDVRFTQRARNREFARMRWRETVHLQHTVNVFSDYTAGIVRQSSASGPVRQADFRGTLTRGSLGGVTVALDSRAQAWRTGFVHRKFVEVGPRISFSQRLPGGPQVTGNASVGYQRHGQGADGDTWADVVQESHVVGPESRFELIKPFADAASVQITAEDGGTIYEEGFDYRMVGTNPFLVVQILPGGRIDEEDVLLVDYRYQVAPRVSARAVTYSYDLILRLGALRFFHRRRAQNDLDEIPPQILPVLRNYLREASGVSFNLPLGRISVSFHGERQRDRTDDYDFSTKFLRSSLTIRLTRGMFLSGSVQSTQLTGGTSPYESLQAENSLEWRPRRDFRVRLYTSYWTWDDAMRDERFLGGGGLLEWNARNRTISLSYDRIDWTDGFDRVEDRLSLRLSRAF